MVGPTLPQTLSPSDSPQAPASSEWPRIITVSTETEEREGGHMCPARLAHSHSLSATPFTTKTAMTMRARGPRKLLAVVAGGEKNTLPEPLKIAKALHSLLIFLASPHHEDRQGRDDAASVGQDGLS